MVIGDGNGTARTSRTILILECLVRTIAHGRRMLYVLHRQQNSNRSQSYLSIHIYSCASAPVVENRKNTIWEQRRSNSSSSRSSRRERENVRHQLKEKWPENALLMASVHRWSLASLLTSAIFFRSLFFFSLVLFVLLFRLAILPFISHLQKLSRSLFRFACA